MGATAQTLASWGNLRVFRPKTGVTLGVILSSEFGRGNLNQEQNSPNYLSKYSPVLVRRKHAEPRNCQKHRGGTGTVGGVLGNLGPEPDMSRKGIEISGV